MRLKMLILWLKCIFSSHCFWYVCSVVVVVYFYRKMSYKSWFFLTHLVSSIRLIIMRFFHFSLTAPFRCVWLTVAIWKFILPATSTAAEVKTLWLVLADDGENLVIFQIWLLLRWEANNSSRIINKKSTAKQIVRFSVFCHFMCR